MGRASDPTQIKAEKRETASRKAAANLLTRLGVRIEQLDRWIEDPPDGETFIQNIQFKVGGGHEDDILAVIRAVVGGEKKVAFHGADTLSECMMGFISRLANGSLTWKADIPYDERKGK